MSERAPTHDSPKPHLVTVPDQAREVISAHPGLGYVSSLLGHERSVSFTHAEGSSADTVSSVHFRRLLVAHGVQQIATDLKLEGGVCVRGCAVLLDPDEESERITLAELLDNPRAGAAGGYKHPESRLYGRTWTSEVDARDMRGVALSVGYAMAQANYEISRGRAAVPVMCLYDASRVHDGTVDPDALVGVVAVDLIPDIDFYNH